MIDIIPLLIAIGASIIVFIILRDVSLWYWKINTIVQNQERLIKSQQETNNLLSEQITIMKNNSGLNEKQSDV